jgi:hypothetical protein
MEGSWLEQPAHMVYDSAVVGFQCRVCKLTLKCGMELGRKKSLRYIWYDLSGEELAQDSPLRGFGCGHGYSWASFL